MTLRLSWAVFAGLAAAAACAPTRAQTHAVKKPETVVRAVAVYEWTGDEAKPTASRLVPVSIFIDNQMEDAGVYLARPVPFALDRGTIFECELAGKTEGTLELVYQRHLQGTETVQLDDGWLGYGTYKPVPKEPVLVAAKKSGPLPQVVTSGGNRPHFSNGAGGSGEATTATADDSSRPKMTRRTSSESDSEAKTTPSTPAASPAPAKDDDPNRPVLVRRDGSEDATPTSASTDDSDKPTMRRRTDSTDSTASSTSDSGDEADRPTLKKRTPAQAKNNKRPGDTASVRSATELNDDPDRPTLHRGTTTEAGVPPLSGLPADMHQLVAVSDAKNRPEHDFTRPWDSFSEQAAVLRQMQAMARTKLAGYDMQPPAAAVAAPATPAAQATAKTGAKAKKAVTPAPPPPPVPVALTDETLKGYTLSYGGAATFVYTASSPGAAGATRYVTVVAQQEPLGELKQALASVTDSNHLDRTPWMRLVDVVDAEASNRASLLFEMREQHVRQFALYRVIGARAEQVFQTGTTE
jgi:hypothetical protein